MITEERCNAAPGTNIIVITAKQSFAWKTVLGEVIDNALDAQANTVTIHINEKAKFCSVSDDGNGCDDLTPFVKFGGHVPTAHSQISRYGIGVKDFALGVGGEYSRFSIESTKGGQTRTAEIDWAEIVRSNSWEFRTPRRAAAPNARGTTLTVRGMIRRDPKNREWTDLLEALGYRYSAAIRKGKQIKLQKGSGPLELLKAYDLPPLEAGYVDDVITVGEMRAHVRVGVVKEGENNPHFGIMYTHAFRVIVDACGAGCGARHYGRIAGAVDLIDSQWSLGKNKTEIAEPHASALFAAVEARCREVLDRADRMGHRAQCDAFDREATARLNDMMAAVTNDAKARRPGRGGAQGTVVPRGTDVRHRDAKAKQPGTTMPWDRKGSIQHGELSIQYYEDDARRLGSYARPTVSLNQNHPGVAQIRGRNVEAVLVLAAALMNAKNAFEPRQSQLPGLATGETPMELFSNGMARCLMFANVTFDGQSLAKPAVLRAVKTA